MESLDLTVEILIRNIVVVGKIGQLEITVVFRNSLLSSLIMRRPAGLRPFALNIRILIRCELLCSHYEAARRIRHGCPYWPRFGPDPPPRPVSGSCKRHLQ